jgi:RHS repeat-associated protein
LNDGTYSYTYDNEGNRTTRTKISTGELTQYAWDYRNRLTSVTTQDSSRSVTKSVAYTYDVYDRRIGKAINPDGAGPATAQTERMVYDGDNIALTFDGNGTQTHRYLYGPGVDQILADETPTSVNWALVDNLGTVRDVIDSQGQVLNHLVYDSYGQVTSETNPSVDFRYGYTGRERDKETGLNYNRARYYDAATGVFISQDPIEFGGGDANLYRYVKNSTINAIDPSGNLPIYSSPKVDFPNLEPIIRDAFEGSHYEAEEVQRQHAEVIADPNKSLLEKTGSAIGGTFASLWTRCNWENTLRLLDAALLVDGFFIQPIKQFKALGRHPSGGGELPPGDNFTPPEITRNRHGQLTNGDYTLDSSGMIKHQTGSLSEGKSQFLSGVDADKAVLDAAAYADQYGLWQGSKAKVPVSNGPVGVHGGTGELTSTINVYRNRNGFIHGAPGSPQ